MLRKKEVNNTMSHLTNKERTLLQDLQSHEEICIQKYNNYANQTNDQQLQQIFQNLAQKEQKHYDTLSQILQGQVPNMQQGQQQGQQQQQQQQQQGQQQQGQQSTGSMADSMGSGGQQSQGTMYQNENNPMSNAMAQEKEASLCHDMLMTEKYVSGAYDTTIFEIADSQIRQAVQHIQQEEQQHGEEIFNYMQANGMYQVN